MSLTISNIFDANFYRAANPDLAAAGFTTDAQLLSHFQTYGLNEGRSFSPLINLNFYRASNSDLANYSNSQLLNHLETYGIDEGRKFSPFVDLSFYNASNPDLGKAGLTTDSQLFQHLETFGINEGRTFSPFVDLSYYNANNADLGKAGLTTDSQLLDHLEIYGVNEGRKFSPFADLSYYNANNTDLAKAGLTTDSQLLQHLEIYGVNEFRKFSQLIDLNYYRNNNPDLAKAGLTTGIQLLEHFELFGLSEGRRGYPQPSNSSSSIYQAQNGTILSGFSPTPSYDLTYYGGKTIANLSFANFYLGGSESWSNSDIQNIDSSLSEAIADPRLNSVISQYFSGQQVTSDFLGSTVVQASVPTVVTQNYIETLISGAGKLGGFDGFNLSSTVFDFMLPEGTVLSQGGTNSLEGLGGYHGSVNFVGPDGKQHTAYYAIGVYSEDYPYLGLTNGIPVFDQPWKNVVATTYHELNEARTDPDVGQVNRTGNNNLLGWYSNQGGEVGDYPLTEASQLGSTSSVFEEVPLVNGQGTVPIQLLYSNAVHGPEDPTTIQLA